MGGINSTSEKVEDSNTKKELPQSNNLESTLNIQRALAETFTLTAFFRSLIDYPYSKKAIKYLLDKSGLKEEELQARWNSFDRVFGEEYGKKNISFKFFYYYRS